MVVSYEGLAFQRPGHATVRIETAADQVIYVDPWSEVIEGTPADADIVFVTHDDRDHYDPDAIEAVATESTIVAAYEAIDASDLWRDVVVLSADDTGSVAGIEVRTVPAYNRPDGPHVRPSGEPYHPQTTVIGLVLTIDGTNVYFCSDTDALEALEDVDADVVLPPIGGTYTMDRREAAALVRAIEPSLVLPVHYDTPAVDGTETDAAAFERELEADAIRVELF